MKIRGLFFITPILLASTLMAGMYTEKSEHDLSKEKVLYAIGYAHLDTQWRWDYQTTINDYIKATLDDNIALLEKYPDYTFNFTGSTRYEMMKEYYPEQYEKVKKYIKEGRWFVSGSSVDENDALGISVESAIRQVLLGNEYFREEFGKMSSDYILPDCFGFMAHTPSVWAHCGLDGFSTQKLTWGSAVGIPFSIGKWQGPDGKDLIVALNPGSYGGSIKEKADDDEGWAKRIDENGEKYGLFAEYHYYGVGDMGGAPREKDVINYTDCVKKGDGKYEVYLASTDQLYKDITPEIREKLPTYEGDFLLTEHSSGSITSQGYIKRWNRKNELLADSAERAAVAADWLGAIAYPKSKLDAAWKRVLSSQFHDILPGTSIPRAYEFSWNDEVLAMNLFAETLSGSTGAVVNAMDTRAKGKPVVVYNPLAIARESVVSASVKYDKNCPENVVVVGPNGKAVPSQVVSTDGNTLNVLFLADVPAVGYAAYDIRNAKKPGKFNTGLVVEGNTLENAYYKVVINNAGDIESVFDKKASKELLASPARLAFMHEKPQHWPAWNMDWADQQKAPAGYVDGPAVIKVVENGPVRVAIEVTRTTRNSTFAQTISLSCGDAGSKVDISNVIDWQTPGHALKAEFPLSVANNLATYNLGLGTIQRANNDEKKYEVPFYQWFDLTDASGDYGVSIMNDCKFGSDKPSDNVIRLTLLYTPDVDVDRNYMEQGTQDWGRHEVKYAIYGHKGSWQKALPEWQALGLNQPMVAFETPENKGKLGKSFSFATLNTDQLDIRAIKKAERDDDTVIVRVQELTGNPAKAVTLDVANGIESAYEVNGQEYRIGDARVKGGKLVFDATPYSLHTFALKLKDPSKKEMVSAPENTIVALDYNVDVISTDSDRSSGMMADDLSYAAELLPETVISEGVEFKLGYANAANAVACAGQEIKLPKGDYNRVYILAAADSDTDAVFTLGKKQSNLNIQAWRGYIGQWENRIFNEECPAVSYGGKYTLKSIETGYIKRAPVAWFSKHIHSKDANEAYRFSYMFKYAIDVPAGCKSITLPDNQAVKVFAITASNNQIDAVTPVQPLYDDFTDRAPTVVAAPVAKAEN